MDNIKIDIYCPSDKRQLIEMIRNVLTDLGYDFFLESKDRDLDDIENLYFVQSGCFWILKSDNKIIGSIAIKPHPEGFYEMKRFYILKEYRSRGYGKLLLEHFLEYAKQNNIKTIRLDTDNKLKTAIHLYQKYGFKTIPPYDSIGQGNYYMELNLEDCEKKV